MKRVLTILFVLIIAFAALCIVGFQKYAHPKGFKPGEMPVQEAVPAIEKPVGPKIIDTGTLSVTVAVLGDDVSNEEIPHDILVTNKITGKSITIPKTDPYHMIINTAGNESNYVILDTGTGTVRNVAVYDINDGSQKISTCNLGYFVQGLRLVYADCTKDKKFDIRAAVVENGQYNPSIYKFDFKTGEKKPVLVSDMTHLYSIAADPLCNSSGGPKCQFGVTSVKKFSDWSDIKKWTEGIKMLAI